MTHAYKVAEHVFHLELPEGCPLEGSLDQYAPFETQPVENPLFTLSLTDELPQLELTPIYDVETEPGEPVVKLYRSGSRWYAEMAVFAGRPVCARMIAEEDFRSGVVKIESGRDALFGINNALMLLYAFSSACLDTLEMHASVVSHSGKAYLFLGKSGTGKSTHSRQWLKYIAGTHLVNDDNPIVRVGGDGAVRVYGSPWSGKTPCYKNEVWPIGAFVKIRQCPENKIQKLGIIESYGNLYSSSSGFKADERMSDGLHATFEKVLEAVPFYLLDCRPDEEAARVCHACVCKEKDDE